MFDFKVTPDDGDAYKVHAGSRDVLVWERTTKGASISSLLADQKMGDLYKLAYLAAKRQELFTGTQAEFEADCEVEFAEAEELDPTQPAP